jgi:hypothetical protein
MSLLGRLAVSVVVALLLPFPGPHIDAWLPMGAVLMNEQARSAPPQFFVLAGVILVVYMGVAFAVLSLLQYALRSFRRRRVM